jgi:hypothetical protein
MLNIKRRKFIALVGGGGLVLATKARAAGAQALANWFALSGFAFDFVWYLQCIHKKNA